MDVDRHMLYQLTSAVLNLCPCCAVPPIPHAESWYQSNFGFWGCDNEQLDSVHKKRLLAYFVYGGQLGAALSQAGACSPALTSYLISVSALCAILHDAKCTPPQNTHRKKCQLLPCCRGRPRDTILS